MSPACWPPVSPFGQPFGGQRAPLPRERFRTDISAGVSWRLGTAGGMISRDGDPSRSRIVADGVPGSSKWTMARPGAAAGARLASGRSRMRRRHRATSCGAVWSRYGGARRRSWSGADAPEHRQRDGDRRIVHEAMRAEALASLAAAGLRTSGAWADIAPATLSSTTTPHAVRWWCCRWCRRRKSRRSAAAASRQPHLRLRTVI